MEQLTYCPDTKVFKIVVSSTFNNVRLDHFLVQACLPDVSRSQISTLIKAGSITVNGVLVKPGYRVKPGDSVDGLLNQLQSDVVPVAEPIDFDILYEDSSILVISKPPGLVVHPGSGNLQGTLVNGLIYHFQGITEVGDPLRPGIVHRLDKDTSGVMVIARNSLAHQRLVQDFKDRKIDKQYLALVHGIPENQKGRIVAPIGRHPVNRQKMAVREKSGKYAASNWLIQSKYRNHCLLEVHIETGRTHQIRVHLAHIKHPVAGDVTYGPNRDNQLFNRQMLHAWKLSLDHPTTGQVMSFTAPPAPDFQEALERVGTL